MKAVIPLAGKGTRLRPHTHLIPKPLLRVAGKPILDCILDDLLAAGVSEVVFIVGHLREAVRAHLAERYPQITAHYAVQEVQDGTAVRGFHGTLNVSNHSEVLSPGDGAWQS